MNEYIKRVEAHSLPRWDQLPDFELTDRYFKLLEKMIMRAPEFYLWTHKRFKYATKLDA